VKSRKFVETATALCSAGRGGNGCLSFRREAGVPRGGPDGGDGGRGGHVILRADRNAASLVNLYYNPACRAEDGVHGKGKQMTGRNGRDLVVTVPCGTEVWNQADGALLADLVAHGQEVIIARGGRGGLGNCHFTTATHQAPREHTAGEPGEEIKIKLVLKTIADIGLIGFPNAGKSTLLSALTAARPKIAAYPFTTLNPMVGALDCAPHPNLTVVDIPGLIKDAHRGVGLGHEFLRHVERTRLLILLVDMAGVDGRHPADDYAVLMDELNRHNPDLPRRPTLLVANKMDLPEAAGNLREFRRRTGKRPLPISAKDRQGLDKLKQALIVALIAKEP
jgi:GTP-binding protein